MASPDLVTPSAVETYLGLTAERDAAELGRVVAAVNDLVGEWAGLTDADEAGERIKFGALMLAARVFRRRNSPALAQAAEINNPKNDDKQVETMAQDHRNDLILDQLVGHPWASFPGWEQLGGRSLVDAIAAIGAHLEIEGFKDKRK